MKKIYFVLIILYIIALFAVIGLSVIFAIILPNSVSKYLVLFYLIALGILIFLLLASIIIEKRNLKNNKHQKTFVYFQDISLQSYLYYVIIIIPLIVMIILIIVLNIFQKNITPEYILQIIYWSIAVGNFIWFYWHLKKS